MAPNDDPNPLLYTPCSFCLNEGWLFCTLCHKYFCEEHACSHLAAQVNADSVRDVNWHPSIADDAVSDTESKSLFRELSADELSDASEMSLRSYLKRLISEAKRIQREIERRMIYESELQGGPDWRRKRYLSQDQIDSARARAKGKADLTPLGLLEREAREQRAKELQRKKQLEIEANIAIIAEQIRLGNITLDAVKKVVKK